jgi:hypothetical protein
LRAGRFRSRSAGRVLPWVALALGIAVALAGTLAWTERRALAEAWLLGRIAAHGVAPAALRVEEVGLRGIAVRRVALGAPPGATIEAVDVTWSARGLRAGRFDSLHVTGLRVVAALDATGLSLGALDPLLSGGDAPGAPLALPARRVTLADARAEVASPAGDVALALEAELGEVAPEVLAGSLRLEATHA